MKSTTRRWLPLASFLLGLPLAAEAHDGGAHVAGFAAGLLHPLTGLDHLVAMVALGIWAALLGGAATRRLPLIFMLAMALGGTVGLAGVDLPGVEAGIAASAILLGALLVFDLRAPLFAGGLIGAVAGLLHGHAHGGELPADADALGYCAGFLLCTAVLHLAGVMLGSSLRAAAARPLLRGAGAAVAASGMFFVWRTLA